MSQQPPFQRPGGQAWNGPQGGGQPPYGQPQPPGQPPYAQPPPYTQPPQYAPPQPQYQQQYSQPPPGYYPPHSPPPKKRRSPLAIIGMVIGVVFLLFLIIGIVGAATGGGKSATATPKGPSSQVVTLTSTLAAPSATLQSATVTPVAAASRPTTIAPTAPSVPTAQPPTAQALTVQPTALPQPLKLVASGFGQTGQQVGVGFVVQNPDPARSLVLSQYQIAAYDTNGVVLKTDSGYIEVALPGQSIGIGRSLYLAEGQTATKVDVQVKPGTLSDKKYPPAFTTEKVTIQPGDAYSISTGHATGIIKSTAPQDVKEVEADIVLYDGAGKIIGGGFNYVDFIPANGQAAVEISLTYAGKPANAAMYGRLSGLSGL